MRVYYTLAEREPGSAAWSIQFGDYDRATVQAEMRDYAEAQRGLPRRLRCKYAIVVSDHKQAAIVAAVKGLALSAALDRLGE